MKSPHCLGRFAAALFAVLFTAAGAPIALCAAMPDCPSMALPAETCHESSGTERHGAPTRVEGGEGSCGLMAAQPLPATAAEKVAAGPGLDMPLPPAVVAVASPLTSLATPAPVSRPARPSGRALLSLHQSLLV